MKKLEQLRTFFRTTNAVFDFAIKVKTAFGGVHINDEMQELHKAALTEVEKESPDMAVLDGLLEKMQNLAEFQAENRPKRFPKGGIT